MEKTIKNKISEIKRGCGKMLYAEPILVNCGKVGISMFKELCDECRDKIKKLKGNTKESRR